MQKHLQILYKSIRLKVQIKGVQNMEKLLDLAVQYDGVKTKILPNGMQFKKDKKSVTYCPFTGTVVSDEKGKIKVHKRAGMELLKKELHAAFYQPVDLYGTCGASKPDMRKKEYLIKDCDNHYWLATDELSLVGIAAENIIEVPEGAEQLIELQHFHGELRFVKKDKDLFYLKAAHTNECWYGGKETVRNLVGGFISLWQRPALKSEYLVDIRGKWELQLLTDDTPESETCLRVPDGAVKAYRNNSGTVNFVNSDDDYMNGVTKGQWISTHRGKHETCGHVLLWQRMESTSDLPFTTPELSEEYQALCDRVEAIDKEAARYMREEAPMLDSFNNDGPLIESFNWEEPPHGYNYWSKLEKALLEPSSYNHIGEKQEAPCAAIGGKVAATLDEREHQYGSFEKVAATTVQLMAIIGSGESASKLSDSQNEALHMICSKIARIVNGDVKYLDNWHDISGYATLIEMELSK